MDVCYIRVLKGGLPAHGYMVFDGKAPIGETDQNGQVLAPADGTQHHFSVNGAQITATATKGKIITINLAGSPLPPGYFQNPTRIVVPPAAQGSYRSQPRDYAKPSQVDQTRPQMQQPAPSPRIKIPRIAFIVIAILMVVVITILVAAKLIPGNSNQTTNLPANTATAQEEIPNPIVQAQPVAPNAEKSVSFGSAPFKGVEQWMQFASLAGLIATLFIDVGMKYKVMSDRSTVRGTITKAQLIAAPLASTIGVVVIVLADVFFNLVDPNIRYKISGAIGALFILIGWVASGIDWSNLGSSLGLVGLVNLVFPKTSLPFFPHGTEYVFTLKDTIAAISANEWMLATRSVVVYTILLVGALLILLNIFRGENNNRRGVLGLISGGIIAGCIFLLSKFTNTAWGLVVILGAGIVNIALDPDGADEGVAFGLIVGPLLLAACGTPHF